MKKRYALLCVLLLAWALPMFAQTSQQKTGSVTGAGAYPNYAGCFTMTVTGYGSVKVTIANSGTAWSGTIQPETSVGGGSPSNIEVTPDPNNPSPQATITANGSYTAIVAGSDLFILCGNTVTNIAGVTANAVPQVAINSSSGGGGGGAVSSVFGRTGGVSAVNTDYGTVGILGGASGTLPIATGGANLTENSDGGTLTVEDETSAPSDILQLVPGTGFRLADSAANSITSNASTGGIVLTNNSTATLRIGPSAAINFTGTLTVPSGSSLAVASGATFTCNGTGCPVGTITGVTAGTGLTGGGTSGTVTLNVANPLPAGFTLNSLSTGFSIAAGTTSKTLTVSNTLTLAGTDSSTLNIGGGGTLGAAAYLGSPIPRANGGLNSTSAGTGILRDGTTPAASELSGDATTSGSNAVTLNPANSAAIAFGPWMGMQQIPGLALGTSTDNVGVACTSGTEPCIVDLYTIPAGDVGWVNMSVFNAGGVTFTWYDEISLDGGTTWQLNGNAHTIATLTGSKDNTTTGMPAGTHVGVEINNCASTCSATIYFTANVAPSSNLAFRPILFTQFVNGDNAVYTCCGTGTKATISYPLAGPVIGAGPQMFVSNKSGSAITYKTKFQRSAGSKVALDTTASLADHAAVNLPNQNSGASYLWDTQMNTGDILYVNSAAGGSASATASNGSGSTAVLAGTFSPAAVTGGTVTVTGCTGGGGANYDGTFAITAGSGSSISYTFGFTGQGAATGCTATYGPPFQIFGMQVYEH